MCFDELPEVLSGGRYSNTTPSSSGDASPTPTCGPSVRALCPITGLPAKYKDPKTGMKCQNVHFLVLCNTSTGIAYANLEAFKKLRTQQLQKEEAEYNSTIVHLNTMLQVNSHSTQPFSLFYFPYT